LRPLCSSFPTHLFRRPVPRPEQRAQLPENWTLRRSYTLRHPWVALPSRSDLQLCSYARTPSWQNPHAFLYKQIATLRALLRLLRSLFPTHLFRRPVPRPAQRDRLPENWTLRRSCSMPLWHPRAASASRQDLQLYSYTRLPSLKSRGASSHPRARNCRGRPWSDVWRHSVPRTGCLSGPAALLPSLPGWHFRSPPPISTSLDW